MKKYINIIGGGLAGCEAAWQIASKGINVRLIEMKPIKYTPAHKSEYLGELVCSNSFKALSTDNASGLLKQEMRELNSLILKCADLTKVPAGGALAVDRDEFSRLVTKEISENKYITVVNEEAKELEKDCINIIAAGPLASESISEYISELIGDKKLYFFDAAAPVISTESINMEIAYKASRYGKGTADYINCPLNREQYYIFYNELVNAEIALIKDFENKKVFEGCMPVEVMAKRGVDTLRFGPLKPVGLEDPKTGLRPYAVIQLRQDNKAGTLYNMVGFQTNLKWGEQKRVFSLIPGLENAEFLRYGVMHRNTYINSPGLLDETYMLKNIDNIYFAGQITGVEGYIESANSGLLAGINAANKYLGKEKIIFPSTTLTGALAKYVSNNSSGKFQPMNANFGIIDSLETRIKDKMERKKEMSRRSIKDIIEIYKSL